MLDFWVLSIDWMKNTQSFPAHDEFFCFNSRVWNQSKRWQRSHLNHNTVKQDQERSFVYSQTNIRIENASIRTKNTIFLLEDRTSDRLYLVGSFSVHTLQYFSAMIAKHQSNTHVRSSSDPSNLTTPKWRHFRNEPQIFVVYIITNPLSSLLHKNGIRMDMPPLHTFPRNSSTEEHFKSNAFVLVLLGFLSWIDR